MSSVNELVLFDARFDDPQEVWDGQLGSELPEGWYRFKVTDVTKTTTKSNKEMVYFDCVVTSAVRKGDTIRHGFSLDLSKGGNMKRLNHFRMVLGVESANGQVNFLNAKEKEFDAQVKESKETKFDNISLEEKEMIYKNLIRECKAGERVNMDGSLKQ